MGEEAATAELTVGDLEQLDYLAAQMILAGLWHSVRRVKDMGCDCVDIRTLDSRHSTLTIGVLPGRRYFFMDNRTSAVYVGGALVDVLDQAGLAMPLRSGGARWRRSIFAENEPPGAIRNQ